VLLCVFSLRYLSCTYPNAKLLYARRTVHFVQMQTPASQKFSMSNLWKYWTNIDKLHITYLQCNLQVSFCYLLVQ